MEPEVIIFDEPTASLDPVNVERLKEILQQLTKMGKTLIISTHDVDFAYQWADRAVVFSNGAILADGPITKILRSDQVLARANLRKPVLMEVYDNLVKHHMLPEEGRYPKYMEELKKLLKEQD